MSMTICTKCGADRDDSFLCVECGHLSKSSYTLDPIKLSVCKVMDFNLFEKFDKIAYINQEQLDVKSTTWEPSVVRRLEYKKGISDKWYEIYWGQNTNTDISKKWFYLVRYGRSGYDGMMQQKWFTSRVAACSSAERKIKEKLSKGYKEVGVALAAVQSSVLSTAVKPPKKPASQSLEVELLHELLGDNDIAL